ncbi:MAG: sialidase [Gemmatimonadetes bacterium]|nr:sialidase [Gemmatimonadota bacterium]
MSTAVGQAIRRLPIFLAALALLAAPGAVTAQNISPEQYSQLRYRHIGPVGNRIASVAGVVGDPLTYYVGAASGGIWKSEDGGEYWRPIFDDQPDHSIGALAVAPSDPAIVWAGTGEPHIRSNVSLGTGVYKSTDGGESWRHMGLAWPSRTSRIVIHPTNPDIVYVAALGHSHGPQRERGIFRTMDGGETWEHVLFVDENTGASSLEMDPNNPRILFAGMWQVEIHTWGRESGGPGSGIHMSRDGGDSWTKLEGNGLPLLPVGKVDICLTLANSSRVYALIETGDGVPWHGQETESGELWRSDDGGHNWQLMTHDRNLGGRTGYYNNCVVLPDDPDEVFFLTAAFVHSTDGGRTGTPLSGRQRPGGDYHDMWIDPTNGDRMIVGNDGGAAVSVNRGKTWHRVQLPIAQMYHVTADNAIPYNVMGNRQDGPSTRGPSNSRVGGFGGGGIPRGMWHSVGGGESGFATPDPTDPNIIWSSASGSGARGGIVVRYDERTRQFRPVEVWPENTGGWPAAELKYRFQWTFPLHVSLHDNNTIFVTSQHVHRTTNGGQSWQVISPDLTTNDKSKQGISGGLTPDNIGVEYCCVIYAFDQSPVDANVLWTGSNDGLMHVTRDGGQSWTNVTDNIPDLPPDGVVRSIDASKWDAAKAYIAIEHHQQGNFEPHVYKTDDYGENWEKIVDGIADSPLSYAREILEDPVRPGLVYLGTENALYVTFNDGDMWQPLMNNLPPAPMYDMVVQEHFNDLVVGTYGRGFWIMDDLSPLQQLTSDVTSADAHLFEPRSAYRFHNITSPMSMPNDPTAGENPEYGASINYWLASEQASDVEIRVATESGETIRTLEGTRHSGINRVWWNLRDESATRIKLRTKPRYADWVDLGPDRWRSGGGGISVLMPPGTYTVTLAVDGSEYTRQLEVLKDPNSEGTEADIAVQIAKVKEIRDDYDVAAGLVNRIEWVRRQIYDLRAVLEDQGGAEEILTAAEELDVELIAIEEELIRLTTTGTGQDGVRYPTKLVGRLRYLAGTVATNDFRPTDQQGEVHMVLRERLEQHRLVVERLLDEDLLWFNQMLQQRNLSPVITDLP